MHSIVFNYHHPSFANVWKKNETRERGYLLRNSDEFEMPPVNIELFRRMPLYTLPKLWNSLGDLRFLTNRTTFIISIKNILLSADQAALTSLSVT